MEVDLGVRLNQSMKACAVASLTSAAYSGPGITLIQSRGSLARSTATLPSNNLTVTMYRQVAMDMAKIFAPVKSACHNGYRMLPKGEFMLSQSDYGSGGLYGL